MTVSKSPRLGLTRWDSDDDPWLRADWDGDNAQLEQLAAMAEQGTFAARPTANKGRRFYYATDFGELYYDTGSAWVLINRTNSIPDADAAVTLSSGITATATDSSRVYRRDGMATLIISVNTDAAGPSGRSVLTVPTGFRPPRDVPLTLRTASTRLSATLAAATGVVTMQAGGSANITLLEGTQSYPLP